MISVGLAHAQPALPHDPAHAEAALTWCGLHAARRELVEALSDCDFAVASRPTDSAALSNRATVHLLAGRPGLARDDLTTAMGLNPQDPTLRFNRGLAHSDLGNRDRAIADYSEAIQLKPDFAIAFHNRGVEFERLGQINRAIADFKRALELVPELPQSRAGLKRLEGRI